MKNQENIWNYNMDECPLDTKVCLLSDNDCFLLPQQEFEGTLTFNGKFITCGECYKGEADYFYRSKIIAWKFINNKMPEIKENDFIKYNDKIYQVSSNWDGLFYDTRMEYHGDYNYDEEYEPWWVEEDYYINDILDGVTAIYRKQGKDYICIWEK